LKIEGTTILTDPVFSTRAGLNFGLFTLGVKRLMAPALAISMRGQAHPDSRTSGFQSLGAAGKSAGKSACATVKALSADENCKLAQYDHAAVHLGVIMRAAGRPPTKHSSIPSRSYPEADGQRHVGDASLRQSSREHGDFAGRQNGSADVRDGSTPGVTIGHM